MVKNIWKKSDNSMQMTNTFRHKFFSEKNHDQVVFIFKL